MPAATVRSDYDQLKSIAQSFRGQGEQIEKTNKAIQRVMQKLEGGDWIGEGAKAFQKEMQEQVMPAMDRLRQALAYADVITRDVSTRMKAGEDEASGCFTPK